MIIRLYCLSSILVAAGVVAFAPSVHAAPVSSDVGAGTLIAPQCVFGTPANGILGRTSDNKRLSTSDGINGGVALTCNSNFTLTVSPPIGTTTAATTFKSTATVCQVSVTGLTSTILNGSCTANVTSSFTSQTRFLSIGISVTGPNAAPAGAYGFKTTLTATPL